MTDETKTPRSTSVDVATNTDSLQVPLVAYSPPSTTTLGNLEQVQAHLYGNVYDGPTMPWWRYR